MAEGSGNNKRWVPVNGIESRFFNDVLVPGAKIVSMQDMKNLQPFDLQDVVQFKPEYLAGWPAVLYDCSLTDASLLGREVVFKQLKPQLAELVEVGREKRNLSVGMHGWSDMTFKHILLPLWTGAYQFRGQGYRLMINGQTGKVSGAKPRDSLKIGLIIAMLVFALLIFVAIYFLLANLSPAP